MISHHNKCIFIHIPKVAGTSISYALKDPDSKEKKNTKLAPLSANDFNFAPPPPRPHFRAIDYVKYGQISQAKFDSYFKFAFVRNPWARIVSEYKYRNHARIYSFKTFLLYHLPQPQWADEYCHIIPQSDFLHDEHGNKTVDFIGKFENLENDFKEVCRHLNIPYKRLPLTNKSQSLFHLCPDSNLGDRLRILRGKFSRRQKQNTFGHYTEYYDDETREYVAELYKNDIETFQYKFGR